MRKRYLAISFVCFLISLLIAVSCFAGSFAFRDEFSTDRAAGAVNGSAAEPGVGNRVVTDTNSKLTIANGVLTFGTGGAAAGDPGLWEPQITRAAGLGVIGEITNPNTNASLGIGWDGNTAGALSNSLQFAASGVINAVVNGGTAIPVGIYTAASNKVGVFLRATGTQHFTNLNGAGWRLNWIGAAGSANEYPAINALGTTSVATSSYLRVPSTKYLAAPIVSDGFPTSFGTSSGTGHAEETGLGSGGSGKVWSNGGTTWSVSGAKAINTPVGGTSLVDANASTFEAAGGIYGWMAYGSNTVENDSGTLKVTYVNNDGGAYALFRDASDLTSNLTVGAWYRVDVDAKVNEGSYVLIRTAGTGSIGYFGGAITNTDFATKIGTFRAGHATENYFGMYHFGAGEIIWLDNFTLKPLTLSELISVVETSTRDVIATVAISTTPVGTQAGLAVGIDSATDPKYGVIAYHDGTDCKLDKLVNGTWTSVISAAATWANNAEIRVIRDGTSFRLYYNNAQIGSTSTISDVGDGTLHGLFNTHTTPMDNFTVYARGSNGEYSNLNSLMAPPSSGGGFGIGFGTGF